jgi:hypothetical protein
MNKNKSIISKLWLGLPGISQIYDPLTAPGNTQSGTFSAGLGGIVSALIPYLMAFAGLILFLMFLFGGFTLLTAFGNADKAKKGAGMLTSALIGFAIIFLAYWIMQLIQIMLGVKLGF